MRSSLLQGLSQFNIPIKEEEVTTLLELLSLLAVWGRRVNLTGISEREFIPLHLLDSLSILSVASIKTGASVIDIGSGAGFPGLPLKIIRADLRVIMVDSVKKKIAFIREAIKVLRLSGAEGISERAEVIGARPEHRERYDYAVSRALARLKVCYELMLPLVVVGGYAVCYKGDDIGSEIKEASSILLELGGEVESVQRVHIPGTGIYRKLVVIKKVKTTPSEYPRSSAKIKRSARKKSVTVRLPKTT